MGGGDVERTHTHRNVRESWCLRGDVCTSLPATHCHCLLHEFHVPCVLLSVHHLVAPSVGGVVGRFQIPVERNRRRGLKKINLIRHVHLQRERKKKRTTTHTTTEESKRRENRRMEQNLKNESE